MEKTNEEELIVDDVIHINPPGFDEVLLEDEKEVSVEPAVEGTDIRKEVREEVAQIVKSEMEQLESRLLKMFRLKGD